MPINTNQYKEAFDMLENENILPFIKPAVDPKDPSENWLLKLERGTAFLCKEKPRVTTSIAAGHVVSLFHVAFKTPKGYVKLATDSGMDGWVDSKKFSLNHDLCEILFVPSNEEKENVTDE